MSVPTNPNFSGPQGRILGVGAGISGVLGVALGAFGAHALKPSLVASNHWETWHTAVSYQMIHTAIAGSAWLWCLSAPSGLRQNWFRRAVFCWLVGIVLFSGSLYILSLNGPRWLGPVTPLGGLLFIAGWVCFAVGAWQSGKQKA
ncbi:MAG: DUF423 domain-containing protein [Nibricoccus sp.]